MSLFVINRYEGEKKESKNESKHLTELLKRIEERKRERASKNVHTEEKNNAENVQSLDHEKKKKKLDVPSEQAFNSTNEDNVQENVEVQNNIQITDQQESHRKKRKKKTRVRSNENCENNELKKEEPQNDPESEIFSNETKNLSKVQEKIPDRETDFMVLGVKTQKKKREVKRVLPEWLANPTLISMDLNSGPTLDEVEPILDIKLIEILKANGIKKLFPVQASMVTWLLDCDKDRRAGWWLKDTCVSAPTGSGKTLAYVLPIVQILQSRIVPKIRCLIVVPVQELAAQVYNVMITYTSHTSLRVGLLSGASSFEQEQSTILKKSARGLYISLVDIVVATPGRLVDHITKTSGFSLDDLRFLVIDEADRAADWLDYLPEPHSHAPQLTLFKKHSSKIPAQKLLFSATLSQDPEKLSRLGLFQPILFTSVIVTDKDDNVDLDKEVGDFVGRYTSPEELKEEAVECPIEYKPVALYQLLVRNDIISKTLVFTNSGETAHRLAILLRSFLSEKDVVIGELSAQLLPKERKTVLSNFSLDKIHILVCSDALARGVDIPDVQLVISYDLPKHIKAYIHRAGRTGRAGKSGTAISILGPKQIGIFTHMLTSAHKAVPNIDKLELDSVIDEINYSHHIDKLKQVLQEEKQNSLSRAKSGKRIQPVIAQEK